MDKDLIQTIACDLGISRYSNEAEFQFHNRVIYSGLACWIKAACQDQPVMQQSNNVGVSRRHIYDKCSKILAAFLSRYNSSAPWFDTDGSSEDAISLIRSRLLRHQDILNAGFNTNVTLTELNYELLSNEIETIRGTLFIPEGEYNGIALTRKPTSLKGFQPQELIPVTKWLDEYLKTAWWEPFSLKETDQLEFFDANRKAANMYQCWQAEKPKSVGKYIIARRPVNVSSHEYLILNTHNERLHRIDPVLKDFGEHRRFMFGFRSAANNHVGGVVNIYPDYVHLKMRTYLPAKERQLLESLAWPHSSIADKLEWDMALPVWNYLKPFLLALGMVFMEEKHG